MKRSGRFEDPCNGRPDTGSGRSGTVYYKPFYRKDGLCYCKIASRRGAEVTLVSGPTAEEEPAFVNVVNVCSAKEMFEAVKERAQEQDIIIKAAAVADYRPKHIRGSKMKRQKTDRI